MKALNLLFILSITFTYSQTARYNNLNKKSTYKLYITKAGDSLKIGDTLTIGVPTSDLGFTYISQGGERVAHRLSDKKVIINKLKTYGEIKNGFKMYIHFKGYGLLPVLIDYETALTLGEIKNSNAKITREKAINKLEEARKLLDLEVINRAEYDKIKTELTPIIIE